MAVRISTASRNAMADAIVDRIDLGSSPPGVVKIYTGTQPAGPDSAATGTLLATLTFSNPAFGAASAGVATASAITSDTNVDATGTAGWFRIQDGNGVGIIDGNITATSGGGDAEFDDINFVAGGTAAISSMTVTMPAS